MSPVDLPYFLKSKRPAGGSWIGKEMIKKETWNIREGDWTIQRVNILVNTVEFFLKFSKLYLKQNYNVVW